MKKIIASITFILAFGGYALYQNAATQPQAVIASATASSAKVTTKSSTVAAAPPPSTGSVATTATPQSQYRDGIYTGSQADAYYGTVQVQVKISGGKIADVTFLSYPSDRGTSRSINSYAMPQLTQEAIQAQSANVNGVSGASDTSAAFRQSLSAALSQAA